MVLEYEITSGNGELLEAELLDAAPTDDDIRLVILKCFNGTRKKNATK